ncbi:hypothetical protein [Bacillus sp. C1]
MKSIQLEDVPEELQKEIQFYIEMSYELLQVTAIERAVDQISYEAILTDQHRSFIGLIYSRKLFEHRCNSWFVSEAMKLSPKFRERIKQELQFIEEQEKERNHDNSTSS